MIYLKYIYIYVAADYIFKGIWIACHYVYNLVF